MYDAAMFWNGSNFRLIVDLETQLTDLQGEFDASKEECVAHQKVIMDLKLSLESVSLERWQYF